jgi:hypothetical protein
MTSNNWTWGGTAGWGITGYAPNTQPSTKQPSAVQPSAVQPSYGGGGGGVNSSYALLAEGLATERAASLAAAKKRESDVTSGYNAQIAKSSQLGKEGYDKLDANYAQVLADAAATRDRNLERVDEYGNSMRSDLDIKNQQALAAASQSAIRRGLGNTTIQDSLVRGQNFDNTRQLLSLEDQLLQNRIATDSSLSGAYQNVMTNRAKDLAAQWNSNTQNDNQLASNKLSYVGGIQEDRGYIDIANVLSQGIQMENANRQAAYDRQLQIAMMPKPKAMFRFVNNQVQKSVDNGHSWRLDTDQKQGGNSYWNGPLR